VSRSDIRKSVVVNVACICTNELCTMSGNAIAVTFTLGILHGANQTQHESDCHVLAKIRLSKSESGNPGDFWKPAFFGACPCLSHVRHAGHEHGVCNPTSSEGSLESVCFQDMITVGAQWLL